MVFLKRKMTLRLLSIDLNDTEIPPLTSFLGKSVKQYVSGHELYKNRFCITKLKIIYKAIILIPMLQSYPIPDL